MLLLFQGKLQNALLSLGQFQSAIDELLGWLDRTEATLDEVPAPVYCDPKAIEIELAKLRILQNDIQAHQASVDSVNEAGQEVIASEGGAEATTTRDKMDKLNNRWDHVLGLARDKQNELSDALNDAKSFHDELDEMLRNLSKIDGQMASAQPVGGLPETAKQQLEEFKVKCT